MKKNQHVVAVTTITEGSAPPDDGAEFPAPGYIHARPGDSGQIESLDGGTPTVRFHRTGTATIVGHHEVWDLLRYARSVKPLQLFLYLLMRDELPTGTVAKIVKELESAAGTEAVYTNPHLARMAEAYARGILTGEVKYE